MNKNEGVPVVAGCGAIIAVFLLFLTLSTGMVYLAWNVGLENAGIVDNEIGWWTALGLAMVLSLVRSIFFPVHSK